jgi:hypothetical protein
MMMRLGLLFDALLARDRNDGIPPALRLPPDKFSRLPRRGVSSRFTRYALHGRRRLV